MTNLAAYQRATTKGNVARGSGEPNLQNAPILLLDQLATNFKAAVFAPSSDRS